MIFALFPKFAQNTWKNEIPPVYTYIARMAPLPHGNTNEDVAPGIRFCANARPKIILVLHNPSHVGSRACVKIVAAGLKRASKEITNREIKGVP